MTNSCSFSLLMLFKMRYVSMTASAAQNLSKAIKKVVMQIAELKKTKQKPL